MKSHEEIKITIPGFVIAAKVWGEPQGRPLVCLHGKLDNAASFDFLPPFLADRHIVAIDFPGVGRSSHYPPGVMPSWKNDGFLLFHMMQALGFDDVDLLCHSLGSLAGTLLAMSKQRIVKRLVFLDVLGPKLSFIENYERNFNYDVHSYVSAVNAEPTVFASLEEAIHERMKTGPLTYRAAHALAERGTQTTELGTIWNFDRRLRCLSSTLPHEDELAAMFKALAIPVGLIKSNRGLSYPSTIFEKRKTAIRDVKMMECDGGHHAHMENPEAVAQLLQEFLSGPI